MSVTDCKKVMREYLYEIDWLKEKIKDLEKAKRLWKSENYIKDLEKHISKLK